jgi:hypothetical protein
MVKVQPLGLGFLFLCASCSAPELPPRWQLEQGCHVWFELEEGRGISASSSDGISAISYGEETLDGPSYDGSNVVFRDVAFAHFAVESGTLSIESLDLYTPECTAYVDRRSSKIPFEGATDDYVFEHSERCTPRSAALGAAAVYLAIYDAKRSSRIHTQWALRQH